MLLKFWLLHTMGIDKHTHRFAVAFNRNMAAYYYNS